MTALGDSVVLSTENSLARAYSDVRVDGAVGRQAAELVELVRALHAGDALTPIVVVHLGNNGLVTEGQLRSILEALAPCTRVVIMNAHVPRRWQDANNALFDRVVPEYPNAVLADWRATSKDHREYFVHDGVHLTGEGIRAYVDLIVRTATS